MEMSEEAIRIKKNGLQNKTKKNRLSDIECSKPQNKGMFTDNMPEKKS